MAKAVISDLLNIFKSSVSAVLPENLIRKSITYNPSNQHLSVVGEKYNLQNKNVYLIGTGKAVQNMAREVEHILNSKIKYGIISIPEGSLNCKAVSENVHYCEGARNNLPDSNSEETTKNIKKLVTKLTKDDLLLVLISGGGSALLSLPKEPIDMKEKTELIKNLANSGADITELNTVRKRLSDIKGGQLTIHAQPATVISLILSDIVGDPLDLIASGPTVENHDDRSKAIHILRKYKLLDNLPDSIKTVIKENVTTEQFSKNVKNHIIGSNKLTIKAAIDQARNLNYAPLALSNVVTGNVTDIAKEYSKLVKAFCHFLTGNIDKNVLKAKLTSLNIPGVDVDENISKDKDICLILGGEITVEVNGTGKGGRNQQLALEFSKYINECTDVNNFEVYLLSAGTDGIDGPTDAAGAIGYLGLIADSKKEGIDVNIYLEENDSYNFYKDFKNGSLHVITGHTNTNVMDVHLIVIKRKK